MQGLSPLLGCGGRWSPTPVTESPDLGHEEMATEQSSGVGSLGRVPSLSLHFPGSCGLPELALPLWVSKVSTSSPACCTAEGAVGRSPDASGRCPQRLGSAQEPSRGMIKKRQTHYLPGRPLCWQTPMLRIKWGSSGGVFLAPSS